MHIFFYLRIKLQELKNITSPPRFKKVVYNYKQQQQQ